jgi:phosphomannomutase
LLQAKKLSRGKGLCVGFDYRDSSTQILDDVVQALAEEGMSAIVFGALPTPALALEAMRRKTGAIMITGSHIPADRNGLKFYRPDGEIDKKDEKAISAGVLKLKPAAAGHLRAVAYAAPLAFVARYKQAFQGKPLKGMRVAVYQHSSVARDLLVELLQHAGAQVTPLGRSDHFIPVDTEAVSAATQELISGWCATGAFDAVVSADGDGDRPLIADETGALLRGDVLGLITALYLGAKTVVTPVTSNSGLDHHLPGGALRTKVGSPFVVAGMTKARAQGAKGIVGFEANGGFFTLSRFKVNGGLLAPLPTRDCFLPILAVLALAWQRKMKLSDFSERFVLPFALAGRLEDYPLAASAALMARLRLSAPAARSFIAPLGRVIKINTTDGLRFTLDTGAVVHLRPSGNAPEFRCYVEAAGQAQAEALLGTALRLIASER